MLYEMSNKKILNVDYIKNLTEITSKQVDIESADYNAMACLNSYMLEAACRGQNNTLIEKRLLTDSIIEEAKKLGFKIDETRGCSRLLRISDYVIISW